MHDAADFISTDNNNYRLQMMFLILKKEIDYYTQHTNTQDDLELQ